MSKPKEAKPKVEEKKQEQLWDQFFKELEKRGVKFA